MDSTAGIPEKRKGLLTFYVVTGVVVALLVGSYFAWTPLKVLYWEKKTIEATTGHMIIQRRPGDGTVYFTALPEAPRRLAAIGKPAQGALERLLAHDDPGIRLACVQALGEARAKWAVSLMKGALGDEDAAIRRQVVHALGRIDDPVAVEPLIAALSDVEPTVRANAVWVLGRTGDARAVKPLEARLRDDDRKVRACAENALEKMRRIREAPRLR